MLEEYSCRSSLLECRYTSRSAVLITPCQSKDTGGSAVKCRATISLR